MAKLFLANILPTSYQQAENKFLMEYICKPNLTTPEYFILSLYSILLTRVPRVRVKVKKIPVTTTLHKSKLFVLPHLNDKA
jgi:hypothetical protein